MSLPDFIAQRLKFFEGQTLFTLCRSLDLPPPNEHQIPKGFCGRLIEQLLGVTNLNESTPDFPDIGLEVKTLPMTPAGKVLENTFLSTISFPFLEGSFARSQLYHKIRMILWVPLIRTTLKVSLSDQIGAAFIKTMSSEDFAIFSEDWDLLTELIRAEEYSMITSDLGQFLHIRPKARNAAHKILVGSQKINPMGFYLRKSYTQSMIENLTV